MPAADVARARPSREKPEATAMSSAGIAIMRGHAEHLGARIVWLESRDRTAQIAYISRLACPAMLARLLLATGASGYPELL